MKKIILMFLLIPCLLFATKGVKPNGKDQNDKNKIKQCEQNLNDKIMNKKALKQAIKNFNGDDVTQILGMAEALRGSYGWTDDDFISNFGDELGNYIISIL